MQSTILHFPSRQTPVRHAAPRNQSAEVISLSEYRNRARKLRTATGVYFVSRVLAYPDGCTAA